MRVASAEGDVRDLLDAGGVDVVVTRDPDLIAYAARRGHVTAPLAWDRTYVLAGVGEQPMPGLLENGAGQLVDAVGADVRPAAAPRHGDAGRVCQGAGEPGPATPVPAVGFAADDDIARQLAERVAALGWVAKAMRVLPVPADSLEGAIATGRVAAVVAAAVEVPAACGRRWSLPLVDSRAHAIVRRGSGVAYVEGADGALWFVRRGAP